MAILLSLTSFYISLDLFYGLMVVSLELTNSKMWSYGSTVVNSRW